ncbi:hypothetical protein IZS58_004575 [Vibrio parahaemolyticus]|nr:hypothetical protein [Vibrio parahaemolyticus]
MMIEYVSGIKAAWDAAKIIKEATDSYEDAHLKLQIAELMSALADAKLEAINSAEKIVELELKLKTKQAMTFSNGLYYKQLESDKKEGPFCATCFDDQGKEIRLQSMLGRVGGNWHCRVCNGWYK